MEGQDQPVTHGAGLTLDDVLTALDGRFDETFAAVQGEMAGLQAELAAALGLAWGSGA